MPTEGGGRPCAVRGGPACAASSFPSVRRDERLAVPASQHRHDLQNSHQNGGWVFLIFVADPITVRLYTTRLRACFGPPTPPRAALRHRGFEALGNPKDPCAQSHHPPNRAGVLTYCSPRAQKCMSCPPPDRLCPNRSNVAAKASHPTRPGHIDDGTAHATARRSLVGKGERSRRTCGHRSPGDVSGQ